MADVFRFKQFAIDQAGCAMKVNTDGVLLGALADADNAKYVLDIGTGTGVIALMMAQRFPEVQIIDAIEIDAEAAATARQNFAHSPFAGRLRLHHGDFAEVLQSVPDGRKYDRIVSNPPFYLNTLRSSQANKTLAKHADAGFFASLIERCALHLSPEGQCWFILPPDAAAMVVHLSINHGLYPQQRISIKSFANSEPHRLIIALAFTAMQEAKSELIIYDAPKVYSAPYQEVLKEFLIIF